MTLAERIAPYTMLWLEWRPEGSRKQPRYHALEWIERLRAEARGEYAR